MRVTMRLYEETGKKLGPNVVEEPLAVGAPIPNSNAAARPTAYPDRSRLIRRRHPPGHPLASVQVDVDEEGDDGDCGREFEHLSRGFSSQQQAEEE